MRKRSSSSRKSPARTKARKKAAPARRKRPAAKRTPTSDLRPRSETATTPGGTRFVVTAHNLNVRAEPNVSGRVVGILIREDVVISESLSGDRYWHKIDNQAGLRGWASHKHLRRFIAEEANLPGEPRWLSIARAEIGVREFPGNSQHNPRIVAYHRSTNLPAWDAAKDETHWCSSFVNWCLESAGYEGTDSAWARSWLDWGRRVSSPKPGHITVFSRQGGGHVGFYISESATQIRVLGGNQSDAVTIAGYPKSRLLGYRVPV